MLVNKYYKLQNRHCDYHQYHSTRDYHCHDTGPTVARPASRYKRNTHTHINAHSHAHKHTQVVVHGCNEGTSTVVPANIGKVRLDNANFKGEFSLRTGDSADDGKSDRLLDLDFRGQILTELPPDHDIRIIAQLDKAMVCVFLTFFCLPFFPARI